MYNFAGFLNPNTFAKLALPVMAVRHTGGGRSPPTTVTVTRPHRSALLLPLQSL